jgi:hypothetical protein
MLDKLRISRASYDDLPEVAQIHVTSWKQTYVGQVPQAYLDNLDVARRLRLWQEQFPNRDLSGLLIAKVNNTAAGFVCFGRARDEDRQDWGEIYAIYVLKEGWLYWRWRSRRRIGRPRINQEIRILIRKMRVENPGWGAPKIHGELLKPSRPHIP